jgi:hypothetical protein
MPGDNVELICELHHDVAADVGTRFTFREGNKTSKFRLPNVLATADGFLQSARASSPRSLSRSVSPSRLVYVICCYLLYTATRSAYFSLMHPYTSHPPHASVGNLRWNYFISL